MGQRITYLDGLRGVAITAVVAFHAYVAYPERLPFGDRFAFVPLRLGWQGVELFFLISGFVILMTLERCRTLSEFAWRRWVRLFPAMLVASLTTLAFLNTAVQDSGKTWINLIPGLTFLSPALIHAITGVQIDSLDGAYWSIYVEVVFYAVFGAVYFALGTRYAIATVFALFAVSLVTTELTTAAPITSVAYRLASATRWIGFIYFGWFASGALFYLFAKSRSILALVGAIIAGTVGTQSGYAVPETVGLLCVVTLFAASVLFKPLQRALASRPLVFIGYVSYPLYLIHEQMLTKTQAALATLAPSLPPALWPIPPIACLVGLAWLIARYIEPAAQSALKSRSQLSALTS